MFNIGHQGKLRPSILVALALLLLIALGLSYSRLLLPLDRLIYDLQIRNAEREPLDDIVIIAIDKYSLDVFGRWPWSRDIHARFLDKIAQVDQKAVVIDIAFSEPSEIPRNDELLAQAIANNSKVVLPVAPEVILGVKGISENLPIKILFDAAAGIGHIDRELDLDAVSRRAYLYAGLTDSIKWPSIALQAIHVAGSEVGIDAPNMYYQGARSSSKVQSWSRSHEYLLPFAGNPGTFKRISFAHVMQDDFDLQSLANKYVLVGATAFGMGDVISTPVSGESRPMPGIEVVANEIDSLLQDLMITKVGFMPSLITSLVVVIFSFLLWDLIAPRYSLFVAIGLIAGIFFLDSWVLHHYRIWFPPANMLVCVALGYLGWIWGRLVETVKYLNSELNRLGEVAMPAIDASYKDANKAFEFLMNVEGFSGGAIIDAQGRTLFEWENSSRGSAGKEDNNHLVTVTAPVSRSEGEWELSLQIDDELIDVNEAEKMAQRLTTFYQSELPFKSRTPVEFINNRIQLVKLAHTRLYLLNNFISQVIDQLHNSVVVTDSFGNIIMANRGTNQLLEMQRSDIEELNIVELLQQFTFQEEPDWPGVFSRVMFNGDQFIAEAKSRNGLSLLVELTRYKVDDESNFGLVFNFIDVTKLKQTEQSRRELLAFLSHDLRSPLASLIATSDLAKIRPEYRESENFVKSIKDNANRALQLADDFLALIRAESISTESFKPVDFTAVVVDSVNSIESTARASQITIVKNLDEQKRIAVSGDRSILERVVINLISNAIKYSPSGRKVEVSVSTHEQFLDFSVKDNGYGIRPQDQEKVFKRFETIKHSKNSQEVGIGLGLAFVKSSVERHNGEISLESSKGQGSCFRIKMPLLDETEAPGAQKISFKESS